MFNLIECFFLNLTMSLFDLDDLPFEFRALELALELTCISLDAQVSICSGTLSNLVHAAFVNYQIGKFLTNLVCASL